MGVESPLGDSSTGFLIHLMHFYPVLSTQGKKNEQPNPPAPTEPEILCWLVKEWNLLQTHISHFEGAHKQCCTCGNPRTFGGQQCGTTNAGLKGTFLNFKHEQCNFSSFCLSSRGFIRCSCRISHHRQGWMDITVLLWILMRLTWRDTLSAVRCAVQAALIITDHWMIWSQLYTIGLVPLRKSDIADTRSQMAGSRCYPVWRALDEKEHSNFSDWYDASL